MMSVSGARQDYFRSCSFVERYKQVICHLNYHGADLKCHQAFVYVLLRVPHDATLKSLCLQFFNEIDRLLEPIDRGRRQRLRIIAPMVDLMNKVATAVSLGFIVVDEVQNLRSARAQMRRACTETLFSEIIERLGISLLALATISGPSCRRRSGTKHPQTRSLRELAIEPMASTRNRTVP